MTSKQTASLSATQSRVLVEEWERRGKTREPALARQIRPQPMALRLRPMEPLAKIRNGCKKRCAIRERVVASRPMDRLPWEITPPLTLECLTVVATTIADVRAEAREGHLPEKGDNAWTFGCRAYSRTCFAFLGLAASRDYPWLTVKDDGLACTLLIGGEPVEL